ncbi:MAG: translation initiation factor eIF-1A [Candidatus Thermoplasmatota archaeon]
MPKNKNEKEQKTRIRLPDRSKKEMFALAESLMGGSRLKVICEDDKNRMARIPGKLKRKQRIRVDDLLIVKPWEIQDKKADIIYRYRRTKAITLSKRNILPENIDVF